MTWIAVRCLFTILALMVCTGSVGWAQAIDFSKPLARSNPYVMGAGVASGATNYCSDAAAELCLYMNNNGGNETDRSANAYTFTQTSGTIPTSADVRSGFSGSSRDFELGDSEYLTCVDATCTALDINGADATISLVASIKPEDVSGTTEYMIINKFYVTGNQRQYLLEIIATGTGVYKIQCVISSNGESGGTTTVVSTTTDYAAGEWRSLACVSNDIDIRLYVDGSLASTPGAHTAGIFDSSQPVNIGAYTSGLNFDGLIDEVAIFSRALSATEVADIYNNGLTGNKGGSD